VIDRVVVLGAGYAGLAILRRAREAGLRALGTTRDAQRATALTKDGLEVFCGAVCDASFLRAQDHVVVTFPPDGLSDAALAPMLRAVAAVTYLSTTGVYDDRRGVIDDATPLPDAPSTRATARLAAEEAYRNVGATVLRCPGIYGPDRGLHVRVVSGKHRIPGDGTRFTSRIHVDDLATLALAAGAVHCETFVVGDEAPAPHGDVVRWICRAWGVPLPPYAPLEEVHETLRADRRVDARRALQVLGVTLRYPTFREGMAPPA
jgi:nucleoside-diphosphate-sugar epimerase